MVFDHLGFNVSDFPAAKAFLVLSLQPLGIVVLSEGEGWAMVGRKGEGGLWFGSLGNSPGPIHVAFAAASRKQVRQFHAAALAAISRQLLRRVHHRAGRAQHRGGVPCRGSLTH
jgi:hypothetical protein